MMYLINMMYLIYNLIILDSFMLSDDVKFIKGNYGNKGYLCKL